MQPKALPETLPRELWRLVATFLAQDSFRSLCLVSRGFRSLMQPELFWHYEQPGYPEDCSLEPFMRVCLARPDLAAAVRKATVHDFETVEDKNVNHKSKRRKKTQSEWKRKYDLEIQRLRSEDWPTPIVADDDAFSVQTLVLFCSLIPNLEHLILDISPTLSFIPMLHDPRVSGELLTSSLSQLRHLQLDFTFEKDGIDLRDIRPLIALSSLKTLQGHRIVCDEYYDRDYQRPISMPRQLSIQHINLMCSVISHDRLKDLIEGCHTLKTFELVYGEVLVGAISECDFEILSGAFLTHKGSLESLTLDFEYETATELLEDHGIKGVMTMSSFECLRHVDLPAWGLLRDKQNGGKSDDKSIWKLLPRSLESLVLRSCKPNIVVALWGLLSSLDTFPNLREIAFTKIPEAKLEGLDEFADACKEKSIGLNKEKCVCPSLRIGQYF